MTTRSAAVFLCFAAPLAVPVPATAQHVSTPVAAPSFAPWLGEWVGAGTVMGRAATATARFAPTLDGQALHFDYALDMGGTPAQKFWGHGVYRLDTKARITGQWSDSNGALHVLKGQWSPREWVVVWGSPLIEIGRSRYALTDDGGLHVIDATLQSDGSWRIFADMRYRR